MSPNAGIDREGMLIDVRFLGMKNLFALVEFLAVAEIGTKAQGGRRVGNRRDRVEPGVGTMFGHGLRAEEPAGLVMGNDHGMGA